MKVAEGDDNENWRASDSDEIMKLWTDELMMVGLN